MVLDGVTHKEVAREIGCNERVFRNKLNHVNVNGYTARFTDAQKELLADRFGVPVGGID